MIVYLCNVGNRDLYVGGKCLEGSQCRQRGQEILEHFEQYFSSLTAPVIEAGLGYIFRQHGRLHGVVLFATDQALSAGEHRLRDTIHIAEVIRRYLDRVYGRPAEAKKAGIVGGLNAIRVRPIRDVNPADYDDMYELYRAELSRSDLWRPEVERVYVSPVGGIPAANTALLLRAVELFRETCYPIYVPEGSRNPVPMSIASQMLGGERRRLVKQFLANRQFRAAADLLEREEGRGWQAALARYAEHRLNFDFEAAQRVLEPRMAGLPPEEKRFLRRLIDGLDVLDQGQNEALLAELYLNAEITWQAGRYVDLLGRLFRFQEAGLRFAVETSPLHLPTDTSQKDTQTAYEQQVEGNPYLKEYLDRQYVEGRGQERLDWRRIERPTLSALVRYLAEDGRDASGAALPDEERARYAAISAGLGRINALGSWRNQTIIAHGFRGVSREGLLSEYQRKSGPGADPLGDMRAVLGHLGVAMGENPFAEIAAFLESRL